MFTLATSVGSPPLWIGFGIFIVAMLALDLGVFNRKAHKIGYKESIVWSAIWISLSLIFGGGVFVFLDHQRGAEFLAAWIVEKALSVDNLFVFLVIFKTFKTPPEQQHRALFWGVVGAVFFRAAFIFAGTAILAMFKPAVYILGGFLVFTGFKILMVKEDGTEEEGAVVRLFKRWLGDNPASFVVLIMIIELSDIIFALDSIPAVLAISDDPFIVVTSNIFAILGLRSLYFLIAGALEQIHYLKAGLAIVLIFVGVKMIVQKWYHVPVLVSLAVIVVILGGAIVASMMRKKRLDHEGGAPAASEVGASSPAAPPPPAQP
jgi:tellurite resistance protein TerC